MAMHLAGAVLAALTLAAGPSAPSADWIVTGVTPVGQPIAVGAVAVGYVARGQRLHIRGTAPDSGAVLWEDEATPSAQAPGVSIVPGRVGERVVFLAPEPEFGPRYASLVVADPATGQPVHRSPAMLFGTAPEGCFGDQAVCVMATPDPAEPVRGFRLNLRNGAYIPYDENTPSGARGIGDRGLVDLGGRPTEEIGVVRDGAVRWRRPLTDAFPAGFSTSYGWQWTLHAAERAYVGSVPGPGERTAGTLVRDLAKDSASAALDEMDGTVLWSRRGTVVDCGGRIGLRGQGVRCRYRGKETISYGTGVASHAGLDVVVEGFDVRTGTTRWQVPLGAATELTAGGRGAAVAGPHTVVAGGVQFDLTDGRTSAPGGIHWCTEPAPFDFHEGPRIGGVVATVCGAGGGTPPVGASAAIGAVVGGYAVVATPDGYRGTPVPPPAPRRAD